jgi:hypothetical protein
MGDIWLNSFNVKEGEEGMGRNMIIRRTNKKGMKEIRRKKCKGVKVMEEWKTRRE